MAQAAGVMAWRSEAKFNELFHEYKRRAFRFAYQLTGNTEDALDLTQEAFLRVHRNWEKLDPDRPFAPWLYQILRNLAIDLARSRGSRQAREEVAGAEATHAPNPETLARQAQLRDRLWEAMNRLPEQQREVLILRDLQGMTYQEIADITETNLTTVNSRLHDARTTLRNQLRRLL